MAKKRPDQVHDRVRIVLDFTYYQQLEHKDKFLELKIAFYHQKYQSELIMIIQIYTSEYYILTK
jgi:hypothetical protein